MSKGKRKRLEESIVKGEPIKLVQRLELKFSESETRQALQEKNNSFKLTESAGAGKRKLIVTVEGIHTGMTKNLTFYGGETLEASVPTWTTPHAKPILTNHNEYSEPLGRIRHAEYVESVIAPGKYTTRMKLEITNQEAIDKVLDGRYLTLSVGGSANKVTCSTCGRNIVAEGFCGHYRGRKYEGKTEATHWMIGEYTGDEISFVNMPADVFAQVIAAELVQGDEGGTNVKKGKKNGEKSKKKPDQQAEGTELDLIGKLTEDEDQNDSDDENEDDIDDGLDENDNGDDESDLDEEGSEEDGEDTEESASDDEEDGDDDEGDDDSEETVEEKVARLEGLLAEKEQAITDLTKRAEEAEASNVTLTAELQEAKENAESLQTKLTEAEENLASAEEERNTFQEQNLKLARFSKKLMAERVVDLRIMQKKDNAEDRESLVESWLASTPKVLESTIQDLQKTGQRFIARITSPGLVQNENDELDEDGDLTESAGSKKPKKALTMADLEEQMVKTMALKG